MRVFYKVNELLTVSIFDDVTYYPRESKLLFCSSFSDNIYVNIDSDAAEFILSNLFTYGKADLTIYQVEIELDK